MSREEIERSALELLLDFGHGVLPPAPIPVQKIVEEHLGLTLLIADPADVGLPRNVLGAIFFEDNEVFVNATLQSREGRFNFTLAHEAGHDRLHRDVVDPMVFIRPLMKRLRAQRGILCRDDDRSLVEVQANAYASALLMPRPLVVEAVHEVAAENGIWWDGARYVYSTAEELVFIGALASRFQVSREAMRNRLSQLDVAIRGLPRQARFF